MKKLPLKTRILQYAIEKHGAFTIDDVWKDLEQEYRGERVFSWSNVKAYFESFIGVGFFTTANMDFNKDGELVFSCVITNEGRAREKYFK